MIVIGLMSGTSADGIDAAVLQIGGVSPHLDWKVLKHIHQPFSEALRSEIFAAFNPATATVDVLCKLNFSLGRAYGIAVIEVARQAGLELEQVDLIGSHGQTVWHIPQGADASTLQIGEPALIAEMTGRPVISNFRTRDMAAGGQGAPLVAYVDKALFTHATLRRAVQNIGGIANVTFLPPANDSSNHAMAFDTGPGNMLIDDGVMRMSAGKLSYDKDGLLAAQGHIHTGLLEELLAHPYFSALPPKTTGRELFGAQFGKRIWERAEQLSITAEDCLATITAFTAESIARAYRQFLPEFPDEVIISGGGAYNLTLMSLLAERLSPARVVTSDEIGLNALEKEAAAFAVLAYETWHQRPGNLPEATGAQHPVVLGNITPGNTKTERQFDMESATESVNLRTAQIDCLSSLEIVERINDEDLKVAEAVRTQLPAIARAVEGIVERMERGGRLIYMGAGTSGRLGILDASECPPTFNTAPERVLGLIAGGMTAITEAVEGAEDNAALGCKEVADLKVNELDSLVGVAASGRTPYVLGGMEEARRRGALVISLTCNHPSAMEARADISVFPVVGPEVITGSTRMKAGTAQKMVLNMLSSAVMIRLGKTYGNLMVDVQTTNIKLRQRAIRIVSQACGISEKEARQNLERCDGETKTAIVMRLGGVEPAEARELLAQAGGRVRLALQKSGSGDKGCLNGL